MTSNDLMPIGTEFYGPWFSELSKEGLLLSDSEDIRLLWRVVLYVTVQAQGRAELAEEIIPVKRETRPMPMLFHEEARRR